MNSSALGAGHRGARLLAALHARPVACRSATFAGQPVVLAFYPADWSPVCGDQMALYNEILAEFRRFDAELLGISVDGIWCHLAFAAGPQAPLSAARGLRAQGRRGAPRTACIATQDGTSERALFVIDGDGIIRWSYVSPIGVNPGADGILSALEALPKRSRAMTSDEHGAPDAAGRRHGTTSRAADAPVTLVEYGDYECPHCGRAYPIVKEVQRRLGRRAAVRVPQLPARRSASARRARGGGRGSGGAQGRSGQMHDCSSSTRTRSTTST